MIRLPRLTARVLIALLSLFAASAAHAQNPINTIAGNGQGVKTEKVIIAPGQMKLFYVIEGKVALHYNGDRHVLEAGDSAVLDGGVPHGWENLGTKQAKALWVILG